jgi:hypothetical protein
MPAPRGRVRKKPEANRSILNGTPSARDQLAIGAAGISHYPIEALEDTHHIKGAELLRRHTASSACNRTGSGHSRRLLTIHRKNWSET